MYSGTHKLDQLPFRLPEDLLALTRRLLLPFPGDLDLAESLEDCVRLRSMLLFECLIALPAYIRCDNCERTWIRETSLMLSGDLTIDG